MSRIFDAIEAHRASLGTDAARGSRWTLGEYVTYRMDLESTTALDDAHIDFCVEAAMALRR